MNDPYEVFEQALLKVKYKPGWTWTFARDLLGLSSFDDEWAAAAFRVSIECINMDTGKMGLNNFMFPLPPAHVVRDEHFSEQDAIQWVFDRFCDIERHEAMEFFAVDDEKPFYPHGDGRHLFRVNRISNHPLVQVMRNE